MRILNIIQCTELGGMEQASLRLMQCLQDRGHEIKVISLNPLGALKEHLDKSGIEAVGMEYRGALGWRSLPTLYRILRRERADALMMTGSNLLAMLALGGIARGRRLLAMHFHHSVRPDWQWKLFYGLAKRRFDAISYPSDFVRLEAATIVPSVKSITRTIRNPLAVPEKASAEDKAAARRRYGLPPQAKIVGNAGWLIDRKRFDVFLRTAAVVAAKQPDVRFAIAGSGPEKEKLQTLAQELGIADRIHWLGWIADMRDFYLSLDVLLFNSDWDAFGNTPVEAMTYGIPVVASVMHGGLGEVITDRRYGFLIAEHDPERLGSAVIEAIDQADDANAENGRYRAVTLSDPARIAIEVEKILQGQIAELSVSEPRRILSS
ncbi:glycosyltransferase [Phyllobacterium sp. SYP-B3895]|uniref:glycosyltransferase n=1 Tax=Phyllobacterium sp. SYP-B3895 TaxID=2663240 RepID=UPI001299A93E|nr:glycosyltransferase [Phyllobacterium sp. SYP-B3895]MRG55393.1 glycosyltransferase [Phyllobacterium sp. SYP-B3895]